MKFVHQMTRLACDPGRAYRFFTNPTYAKGWLGDFDQVTKAIDAPYHLRSKGDPAITLAGLVKEADHEKLLKITWEEGGQTHEWTLNFMKCRPDTEYCTELHLMHKILGQDMPKEVYTAYNEKWKFLMEQVRQYQNKDWVIQDRELTQSWLRGRSL